MPTWMIPQIILSVLITCGTALGDFLAQHPGIDIDFELLSKMDYNETRPYLNGKKF